MKSLDRKALLAAKPEVPSEVVDVPEFGGSVTVKGMTGKEQTALYKAVRSKGGQIDEDLFAARLIVQCLVDKGGNRLLEDSEATTVLDWPGVVVTKLAQVAMRVNGLSDRGNSNATGGEDSSLD